MTNKQKMPGSQYLVDLNVAGAPTWAGYSRETVKGMSYENLTKLHMGG